MRPGVDDSVLKEPVEKNLSEPCRRPVYLTGLLAEDEDLVVLLELLGQGLVQGLTDGVLLDPGGGAICPDCRPRATAEMDCERREEMAEGAQGRASVRTQPGADCRSGGCGTFSDLGSE